MITWFHLTQMDLRGRDLVIRDSSVETRGRIRHVVLEGRVIEFYCEWFAQRLMGTDDWNYARGEFTSFGTGAMHALCQMEDGSIMLPIAGYSYGCVLISTTDDALPTSAVPGLDTILEISEEIPFEDLPEEPDETMDDYIDGGEE